MRLPPEVVEMQRDVTIRGSFSRQDVKPCGLCGKGVAHANGLTFYRVTVERFVLDHGSVSRESGLDLMMGNAALAAVFSPQEPLARRFAEPFTVAVCDACDSECGHLLARLLEKQP